MSTYYYDWAAAVVARLHASTAFRRAYIFEVTLPIKAPHGLVMLAAT